MTVSTSSPNPTQEVFQIRKHGNPQALDPHRNATSSFRCEDSDASSTRQILNVPYLLSHYRRSSASTSFANCEKTVPIEDGGIDRRVVNQSITKGPSKPLPLFDEFN
jgi:hypothetical protein